MISICSDASHKSTLHLYVRVTWILTLGHVGGGNRCAGDTLLRVTTIHAG